MNALMWDRPLPGDLPSHIKWFEMLYYARVSVRAGCGLRVRRSNSLSVRHFSLSYSPTTDVGKLLTRERSRAPAVSASQLSSNAGSNCGSGGGANMNVGGGSRAKKDLGSVRSAFSALRGDPERDDLADAKETRNDASDAECRWRRASSAEAECLCERCGSASSRRNMPKTFLSGDVEAAQGVPGGVEGGGVSGDSRGVSGGGESWRYVWRDGAADKRGEGDLSDACDAGEDGTTGCE